MLNVFMLDVTMLGDVAQKNVISRNDYSEVILFLVLKKKLKSIISSDWCVPISFYKWSTLLAAKKKTPQDFFFRKKSIFILAGKGRHELLPNEANPNVKIPNNIIIAPPPHLFAMVTSVIHELRFAFSWITLNKDPTVWLDGASLANNCSQPSFGWITPAHGTVYPPLKAFRNYLIF